MDAADQRKNAALGEPENPNTISIPTQEQRRAIFSGFDLDEDELTDVAERAGSYMANVASSGSMTLPQTFATCWIDALLVGMMVAQVAHSHGDTVS